MPKLKTQGNETVTAGDLRKGGNARTLLYSTVQRYERLQEERDALGEDQKEVMGEAKSSGLDTAIIRKVIQRRKHPAADIMEADSVLDLYEETIREAERAELAASEAAAGEKK